MGISKENKSIYDKKYRIGNLDHIKAIKKKYTDRVKYEVFTHYSTNLECVCCSESEYEFLTMDHMNDKSTYAHPEYIRGGWALINWIHKNKYPDGFRILCFNCNSGRGKHNMKGICPHEKQNNNEWKGEL